MAASGSGTVSAVLIVKNEEDVLATCLEALTWADEIVVYDTGSTDATRDIARLYTDKVIEGYWDEDFGAARNRAKDHATMEWHLTVDADEVFLGDPDTFRRHLEGAPASTHGFMLVVENIAASTFVGSTETTSVRAFRRRQFTWRGALHEQPVALVQGKTVLLKGARLRHSGYGLVAEDMAHKGERNVRVAEAELERAEASDEANEAELAILRANLARSMAMAGDPHGALELGEKVWTSGDLPSLSTETLARGMASGAVAAEVPRAAVEVWIDRWQSVAGNPAWAYAARAELAAKHGDAAAVLDSLECVPTTVVDHLGQHIHRRDYARLEIWALAKLGKAKQARRLAVSTAAAGSAPMTAEELLRSLGDDGLRAVVAALDGGARRTFALLCAAAGGAADRLALDEMANRGPVDVTLAYCAQRLAVGMTLEEATEWAVRVRAAGYPELCPLVAFGAAAAVAPRLRVLASALAISAFDDNRALPFLEVALGEVDPAEEVQLLAELEVVAPGLVTRA